MKKNTKLFSLLVLLSLTAILGLSCTQATITETLVTVSYDVNGHGEAKNAITVKVNSKLTKEQLAPLADDGNNYFVGWFNGDEQINEGYEVKADLKLKARWDNYVKVTFISSIGTAPSQLEKVKKGTILSKDLLPKYEGKDKVFDGWYLEGKKAEGGVYVINDNVTLTAKWLTKISLTFTEKSEVEEGEAVMINTIEGATVYYTTDGTPPTKNSSVYKNSILIDSKDKTFVTIKAFAVKDGYKDSDILEKTYNIKMHQITIDYGFKKEVIKAKKGEKIILEENLTRDGYTFKGWSLIDYSAVQSPYVVGTTDITIKAEWITKTYDIKYMKDNKEHFTDHYSTDESKELEKVDIDGFRFDGWYDNPNLTGKVYTQLPRGTFGNKIFYGKWTDIAPENINGISITNQGNKIKISWVYPTDVDLKQLLISYDDKTVTLNISEKSCSIENCEYNKEYLFTFVLEDNNGNKSSGISKTFLLEKEPQPGDPTQKPIPCGSVTLNNKEFELIKFGDWPQSLKADNVTVSKTPIVVNGWTCYQGSDNYKYVKLASNNLYYKIEPIQWRVLTNNYDNGKKLLLAQNALIDCVFFEGSGNRTIGGQTIYPSNFEYSNVRAYLNGLNGSSYEVKDYTGKGFINMAFTEKAIKLIQDTQVKNSVEILQENGHSSNIEQELPTTTDKIFLLNETETKNKDFGFADVDWDDTLIRMKTAYLFDILISEQNFRESTWLLRGSRPNSIDCMSTAGMVGIRTQIQQKFSVVPALCIAN